MILVDSSVLISYFKDEENPATRAFQEVLHRDILFEIHQWVYLEVLQGSRTKKDFRKLKRYLETQIFFDVTKGKESYAEAARMFFALRKKGLTIGSTADCLIARVAIENGLYLLHQDEDFIRISRHFPLKLWNIA